MSLSVLAVVVLYGRSPERSPALQALLARQHDDPSLRVVLWNNGPDDVSKPVGADLELVQRLDNPGLPVAYNQAMRRAVELGCEWLLVLDQDTELPAEFWRVAANRIEANPALGIWAPMLWTPAGTLVSPCHFRLHSGFPAGALPGERLPLARWAFLNSGLLIRATLAREAGGWPESVFLDGADFALRHRLLALCPLLGVLPVSVLHHFHGEEAGVSLDESLARHGRYLRSNAAFAREARTPWPHVWALVHSLRLSMRYRDARPVRDWLTQARP